MSELHSPVNEVVRNEVPESGNSFNFDKRVEKQELNDAVEKTDNYNYDHRVESYKDDNGVVYRDENGLKENTKFESNGYQFETDDKGRPKSAEGVLRLKPEGAKNATIPASLTMKEIANNQHLTTDDRGHLIGKRFDGPAILGNLVAMDFNVNRGEYNKMEEMLAKEIKAGKEVYMKVEPQYKGDSHRPAGIHVTYTINGEQFTRTFRNRSDI